MGEPQPVLLSVKEKALPHTTFLLLLFKSKLQLSVPVLWGAQFFCMLGMLCVYVLKTALKEFQVAKRSFKLLVKFLTQFKQTASKFYQNGTEKEW